MPAVCAHTLPYTHLPPSHPYLVKPEEAEDPRLGREGRSEVARNRGSEQGRREEKAQDARTSEPVAR